LSRNTARNYTYLVDLLTPQYSMRHRRAREPEIDLVSGTVSPESLVDGDSKKKCRFTCNLAKSPL
jgi:hypothetical protein